MERILTAEQMRLADEYTINKLGVPQEILVERAGICVVEEIKKRFIGGRVLVCIGKGNNGADGIVIARELSKVHGFSVTTLNVSNGIFKLFDKKYDIVVDCIFGTGLNRNVDGKYKTAIERINSLGAFVVTCDISSGLNGNNGKVMGCAVKANLTVAIQEYKLGHFLNDGPDYSGEVVAKDIGISIWGENYAKKLNDSSVSTFFPKRNKNVHKGNFGKACVFGGSINYTGSIILSANALCALKMGVGYVNLVVPNSLFNAYVGKVPEALLSSFDDGENVSLDENCLNNLLKYDSIAIGMGMGVTEKVYQTIKYLLTNYNGKLLIDADGLNSISKFGVEILKNKKCEVVLTPHVAEFSRLTGKSVQDIIDNPINSAIEFAQNYGVVLLLKNATSIITDGNEVYLNTTGTPAMAKAGSGDVLSGLTAGLLARNNETLITVAVASYLFGKLGESASAKQNDYTVIASDLIDNIPLVINEISKQ